MPSELRDTPAPALLLPDFKGRVALVTEIGRASCRERV